uniref:CUB domain-containing protein n=1 Tax=Caenorhabditis tropicalis TaxID=1561998 RepID=A0A1I7T6L5_9PELO
MLLVTDNRALVNLAASQGVTHPIWLGLTCSDNESEYDLCTWEDESGYSTSYSNFGNSFPFLDIGPNIYLLTSGSDVGKWVSADGTIQLLAYYCEVPTNGRKFICPNELNGFCYTLNLKTPHIDGPAARDYCRNEFCGDLVSIHSLEENNHLHNLFPYMSLWDQFRIGAASSGNGSYWLDGTDFDYCNSTYFNSDIGKCSSYSIYRDVVAPGEWMNSPCDEKIPFVCKRPRNATACGLSVSLKPAVACGSSTPPVVPNDPKMCWQSQFFTGNGTIYSPYYPDNYNPVWSSPCVYIITVAPGSIAQIKFSPDTLINYSKITLFSQLEDGKAFGSFTKTPPPYPFNSTTNVIKMVFNIVKGDRDQEDNRALINLATSQGQTNPIWLGLTCKTTSWGLCTWEDESGYTSDYNAFANGEPYVGIGNNVYSLTTGGSAGKWISADGTITELAYFCEVPTNNATGM